MKSTNLKLALIGVALCGVLAACKPATVTPVVEIPAPVAEPAPAVPALESMPTDPAAKPIPPTEDPAEADEDSPHSGGDKVRPAGSN